MSKKILTVCPSIGSDKFKTMEKSFYNTSTEENVLFEVRFGTVTEAINFAFERYPNYDYYHITNDDVIYQTQGWDRNLCNKGKISYGNDYLQGKNLCTFPMIDGDIVRAVGWLQLPTLNKYCGDSVWKFIGEQLNILEYHPEVTLEHFWEGADEEINEKDMQAFADWLPMAHRDINKIKEILK